MSRAPYTEGPMEARICFIGEAPGEDEVRWQKCFVGKSGKLFDNLLANAGIIRSACRIENVIQERPMNNDITKFIEFKKGGAVTSERYKMYVEQLKERLEQCAANVLVPLGNVPLYALTGLTAITKRRGSVLESTLLPGRKVIPTIHPSAALRQFLYQRFIAFDLARILHQSPYPERMVPERILHHSPHYAQILDYLDLCNESEEVAFDIEVMNLQVSHISFALSALNALCIPFYSLGKDNYTPDQETELWLKIAKILENPKVKKWAHNAVFDVGFIFKRYGIVTKNAQDTMIAQATLFPDFPKNLGFVTSIYGDGEPYYKDEGKMYWKNPFGSEQIFRLYNAKDSALCFQAAKTMQKELERTGNTPIYEWKRQLVEPLVYMQERGILMDTEGLARASHKAERDIIRYERVLDNMVKDTAELKLGKLNIATQGAKVKMCLDILTRGVNHKSPKQLKEYFYGVLGYPPYHKTVKTPKGKKTTVTVDELALTRLERKGAREAAVLLRLRKLSKAKSTYYDIVLDTDNRLRCSFNPVGTVNDRLSSSKTIFGTGGNLQNQTPEMKRRMIPDPGCAFIQLDLGQAENRVVAFIANEPMMMEAFTKGIDIHVRTAALILGIDESEVQPHERNKIGKPANHGLNYGLGYKKFALRHGMEEAHANFIVERYHAIYPGVRQWHNTVQVQLGKDRTLTNLYGRRRKFLDRWSDELFKSAYDYIPQSTVGTKVNLDGIIYMYSHPELFGPIEIINQVHDSMILQFPLDYGAQKVADALMLLKASLESELTWRGRSFSIPADLAFGFNLKDLTEFKSKEIKDSQNLASYMREVYGTKIS